MRRFLALSVALIALIAAGFLWTRDHPVAQAQATMPLQEIPAEAPEPAAEPQKAPKAPITDATREARRFNRYDKNKDSQIGLEEYLANRKKAYAKLDLNKDGKLEFEEYTAATARKFKKADKNGNTSLSATEFATTAIKRKPKTPCKCETDEQ